MNGSNKLEKLLCLRLGSAIYEKIKKRENGKKCVLHEVIKVCVLGSCGWKRQKK